jgi:hypothetical protein
MSRVKPCSRRLPKSVHFRLVKPLVVVVINWNYNFIIHFRCSIGERYQLTDRWLDKWLEMVSHSWDKFSLRGTILPLHHPKMNAFSWRRSVSLFHLNVDRFCLAKKKTLNSTRTQISIDNFDRVWYTKVNGYFLCQEWTMILVRLSYFCLKKNRK